MDIGKRLRELRLAMGFSQGDIERRTGLLRCYVSRIEGGHSLPNLETLGKWANALDVELYQLFYVGEGKPEKPRVTAKMGFKRGSTQAVGCIIDRGKKPKWKSWLETLPLR